jgi:hypothetical protein
MVDLILCLYFEWGKAMIFMGKQGNVISDNLIRDNQPIILYIYGL